MNPSNPGAAHEPPAARPKTRPKQAMIRSAQQSALDDLARDLHDARSVKGERITANTVIRVAIDGIVPHGARLHGDNEEQLLASWREFLEQAAAVDAVHARASEAAQSLRDASHGSADEVAASVLVRVAVEGLLAHQDRLRGRTEDELLTSWLEFLDDRDDRKRH